MQAEISRTDRFVRFLSVLGFGRIATCFLRQILAAIGGADDFTGALIGFLGHLHTVGTHISDLAILVELLRGLHGALGGEAEATRCILLKCRGDEWWWRITFDRLGFNCIDGEPVAAYCFQCFISIRFVREAEFFELLAIQFNKARLEGGAVRGLQVGHDLPVFLRFEHFDFAFTLADQAQRNGLHAASGPGTRKLAPQDRRKREAYEIIESTSREIGIDQLLIDIARVLHRFGHGRFGDRVEYHAAHANIFQNAAIFQRFEQVPGNGFAFTIGVGRENELL